MIATVDGVLRGEGQCARRCIHHGITSEFRSMLQFAESEVVIPTGRYEGRRFRCDRQPYTRLWFNAIDSGQFREFSATGPTQSGKSLCAFIIPILYHVFERRDTVVVGLPDMDMASDKWFVDLAPVIEKTRYRTLMPRFGRGSRGGKFDTIQFQNGAKLKFMTGGGSDKSRSAFTAPIICFTEVDGLDTCAATSVEATKVRQIEVRSLQYGGRRRIYKECTVSVEEGHIWQCYVSGTESSIATPCPHCGIAVSLERPDLVGWQNATDPVDAMDKAHFRCNSCQHPWTEEDRRRANLGAMLVHRGQQPVNGEIRGLAPNTPNLGFRWSAVNNLFLSAGFLGEQEFRARADVKEQDADRQMHQFFWCLPYDDPNINQVRLNFEETCRKQGNWAKGLVPEGTQFLTCGIDLGKRLLHWTCIACFEDTAHIVDYGRLDVPSDDMPIEGALMNSLRTLREFFEAGWVTFDGKQRSPDQTWIDAGWMGEVVYSFIRESNPDFYRPAIGRGVAQTRKNLYKRPRKTGAVTKHIGTDYHISWMPSARVHLVEVNADAWKSRLHQMLILKSGKSGTMTLFRGTAQDHITFTKHMMSEEEVDEFIPGRGNVKRWDKVHGNNHYFDSTYLACAAASFAGFGGTRQPRQRRPLSVRSLQKQDGYD